MTDVPLSESSKRLLRSAYQRSEGVGLWSLVSSKGLSVRQITIAFRELSDRGFVEERDEVFFITPVGRNWLMQNQDEFVFSGRKTWRDIPEELLGNQIPAFAPYAPSLARLGALKTKN